MAGVPGCTACLEPTVHSPTATPPEPKLPYQLSLALAEAVRIATTLWTAEITQTQRWRAIPQMVWPRWGRFDADFSLRDDRLILSRMQAAFGDLRLEDLPVPLRVSATDAASGAAVVIRRGRVVDALRASMAMPFMFAPQHLDGRRLVDGFVSDPLPVSAASDAHAVIALGFEALMPQRVRPCTTTAMRSSSWALFSSKDWSACCLASFPLLMPLRLPKRPVSTLSKSPLMRCLPLRK